MSTLRKLWQQSPSLTGTFLFMLALFLFNVVGLLVDARIISGAPAWLKPAKFAISTGIYSITVAWIYSYLTPSKTLARLGDILATVLILEVIIINIQAFRGTISHYNLRTVMDGILFSTMGLGILILWLASVAIMVQMFRQNFSDPAWGWALRLAMLITVIGSAGGGLMLRATAEQSVQLQAHQKITAIGGHTVGAPDGGAGIPGVGWSEEHGDLRIPHFLGLHAIQIVPLFFWLAGKRKDRTAFAVTVAVSYFVFIAIFAAQALAGESVIHPGTAALAALGIWFLSAAGATVVTA